MTIRDTFGLPQLEIELTIDEGRFKVIYRDTRGFHTTGIGHNLDAGPLPNQTFPMTDAQIDALFASDISTTIDKLDTYMPWWRSLDPVRQRVLINMCFNMGIGRPGSKDGLLSFNRFLYLVQAGQFAAAADDMLNTLWRHQVGERAVRLSIMMRSGVSAHNHAGTPAASNPLPPAPAPQAAPPMVPYPPHQKVIPVYPPIVRPAPRLVYNSVLENILEAIIRFLETKV